MVDSSPDGDALHLPDVAPRFALEAIIGAASSDLCLCRGKETILLVEDEAFVRKATAETLESAGYRMVLAATAAQAKAAYRDCFEFVDLLLADVVLPGPSGHELAAEFLVLCPQVRILLMSGYAEQLTLCELSPYRKNYLAKPFSISTLLQRVRQVLDRTPFDFGASA